MAVRADTAATMSSRLQGHGSFASSSGESNDSDLLDDAISVSTDSSLSTVSEDDVSRGIPRRNHTSDRDDIHGTVTTGSSFSGDDIDDLADASYAEDDGRTPSGASTGRAEATAPKHFTSTPPGRSSHRLGAGARSRSGSDHNSSGSQLRSKLARARRNTGHGNSRPTSPASRTPRKSKGSTGRGGDGGSYVVPQGAGGAEQAPPGRRRRRRSKVSNLIHGTYGHSSSVRRNVRLTIKPTASTPTPSYRSPLRRLQRAVTMTKRAPAPAPFKMKASTSRSRVARRVARRAAPGSLAKRLAAAAFIERLKPFCTEIGVSPTASRTASPLARAQAGRSTSPRHNPQDGSSGGDQGDDIEEDIAVRPVTLDVDLDDGGSASSGSPSASPRHRTMPLDGGARKLRLTIPTLEIRQRERDTTFRSALRLWVRANDVVECNLVGASVKGFGYALNYLSNLRVLRFRVPRDQDWESDKEDDEVRARCFVARAIGCHTHARALVLRTPGRWRDDFGACGFLHVCLPRVPTTGIRGSTPGEDVCGVSQAPRQRLGRPDQ